MLTRGGRKDVVVNMCCGVLLILFSGWLRSKVLVLLWSCWNGVADCDGLVFGLLFFEKRLLSGAKLTQNMVLMGKKEEG